MIILTIEQKQALKKLYLKQSCLKGVASDTPTFKSYLALRRAIVPAIFGDYIMIDMGYCWLGIEPNGYTHS
jgi:hypothetical protein